MLVVLSFSTSITGSLICCALCVSEYLDSSPSVFDPYSSSDKMNASGEELLVWNEPDASQKRDVRMVTALWKYVYLSFLVVPRTRLFTAVRTIIKIELDGDGVRILLVYSSPWKAFSPRGW